MADAAIDKRAFRDALGAFVTGVTIVTTIDADNNPVGLTANSFNSVSLDPPLVLWSLALNSASLPAFRQASHWAVHILSAGQEDLSNRFATKGHDKFAGLQTNEGPGGIPLFDGCTARFVCRATFEYEGGDHAIFVGEVLDLTREPTAPLIYHAGRYGRVMPQAAPPPPIEPGDDGAFGRHFLGHLLGRAHHQVFHEVRREYRSRGLRAADYTVLVSLGLGDGCTQADLVARAARGGVELPQDPIDRLIETGHIAREGDLVRLTHPGRRMVMELVAVAQASQLRLEDRLSPEDMRALVHLLGKLSP